MFADDRLEELEAELRNGVDSVLLLEFDREHWARHNEPSAENLQTLDRVFHAVLGRVAWAGVNVPFPHDTQAHLEAVSDNVLHTWIDMFYADIRTEMVMIDHYAHVIQRNWKDIVTNPKHPVCRRRLLREFDSLRDE